MKDFEQRLQKAIERGQKVSLARERAEAERAMSQKELRRLHGRYRLDLVEHIETCLRSLSEHLDGFRFETLVSESGWGAAISCDHYPAGPGRRRATSFSRLEMLVAPISASAILEITAKATIHSKEHFNRSYHRPLPDVDLDECREIVDRWALEYAELCAAHA